MDIFEAQEIVDEIAAICIKHKVALIGGSLSDDIRGEIRIVPTIDLTSDDIDHLSSGDAPYKAEGVTVVNGIA